MRMQERLFALTVFGVLASAGTASAVSPTAGTDDNSTNGNCTLREAIRSVNEQKKIDACNWTAGDTKVNLVAGTTYHVSSSITLTAPIISILGAGYRKSTIDFDGGSAASLIVAPSSAGGALMTDLTIQNSKVTAVRIDNSTSVTLSKVKIKNTGEQFGGNACIKVVAGNVTFDNSEMSDCRGTGMLIAAGASGTVRQSTIVRSVGERGGAIQNAGTLLVDRSTLGNNSSSVFGAAVLNLGTATIYGSTIAYNTSDGNSGALHNQTGATMSVQYSIVANNVSSLAPRQANCFIDSSAYPITSKGYNVNGQFSAYTCFTTAQNTDVTGDPMLSHDANNDPGYTGGVGAVYVPASTSVASRKIPNSAGLCQDSDQRGVARFHVAKCDIGPVERLDVLLVTANPPQPGDYVLNALLFNMGANITTVTDTDSIKSNADNMALVVISESVTSTNVNTKFRDVGAPILNLEPLLVDDLRMTGPTQNTHYGVTTGTTVTMTGARGAMLEVPHLFGVVDSNVVAVGSTQNMGWTKAPSGSSPLISATSSSDSSRKMLIKFFAGNPMYNGFSAPGPRTAYFATDAACSNASADGQALLNQVMVYAASP